jgi:hypothetical protein
VDEQVPSFPTTIDAIMRTREFEMGTVDGRAGRGYPAVYDGWDDDRQWNYERGRQWAALAPRSVVLKHSGKVTAAPRRGFATRFL